MHELSITRNIVSIAAEHAAGRRVDALRVAVGKLTGIEVASVRFCFDLCAEGTLLSGARLEIEEIPGRAVCSACGVEREIDEPLLRCGCGSDTPMKLVAGEELMVRSMEVRDV